MKKILGILSVLVVVCIFTAIQQPNFARAYNVENLVQRTGLYGILSIGVVFVIVTGGIDLSVGSVVGLVGCLLPFLLAHQQLGMAWALLAVVAVSLAIGLSHGFLVTKLRLPPFVVTLCGLLLYRGIARWITHEREQGFGTAYPGLGTLAKGRIPIPIETPFFEEFQMPVPFLLMSGLALLAAIFLHLTVWGRYLLALGRNEQAARYSGIDTDRMTMLAYVLCSLLAGLGGVLFSLELNSIQPASFGEFFELYAIAAAVLGGCSLRGGEASILGAVIGTAVIQVLPNSVTLLGIPSAMEFAIVGGVILMGVIADELVKRLALRRRARIERRQT